MKAESPEGDVGVKRVPVGRRISRWRRGGSDSSNFFRQSCGADLAMGVAGIHRLLAQRERIRKANCVAAVAGMERGVGNRNRRAGGEPGDRRAYLRRVVAPAFMGFRRC